MEPLIGEALSEAIDAYTAVIERAGYEAGVTLFVGRIHGDVSPDAGTMTLGVADDAEMIDVLLAHAADVAKQMGRELRTELL